MMDTDDGLRLHRQGRLDARLGRGDRDGRDALHGQVAAAPVATSTCTRSCGQCTPCREGTGWLYRMVDRIEHGQGRPEDLDLLDSVADNIQGRTICALGDAAAMPVRGMIKHFRDEFEHHIEHKRCLVPADVSTPCSGLNADDRHDRNRTRRQEGRGAPKAAWSCMRPTRPAPTSRTSAITRSSRSRPTAACAWSRSRRRPSRCRPAPRR